jgi:propanediol dehydratase small subunit
MSEAMAFDPKRHYPLGTQRPDLVTTPSGRPLADVTFEAARSGDIASSELRATAATLLRQAQVARTAGRAQLADNLERAAELTAVPDDELLAVYSALRPGRSTTAELEAWARSLDGYGAAKTAAFVREAASAYTERGLVA